MKYRLSSALTFQFIVQLTYFFDRDYVEMFPHMFDQDDDEEYLLPGPTYRVEAARPGSLKMTDITTDKERKEAHSFIGNPFDVFVSDGVLQYALATTSNEYIIGEAAELLTQIKDDHGPISDIAPDILFEVRLQDTIQNIGTEVINGIPTTIFQKVETKDGIWTQTCLYIADTTGLPISLSVFSNERGDDVTEIYRADFSNWVLDVDLPAATFDTTPPVGACPCPPNPPRYDETLQTDMPAAPFEATDIQGNPISLDQYAGRMVLLHYYGLFCQPCWSMMKELQRLYERFRSSGFEIIGISLDDMEYLPLLHKFIRDSDITWPQICDGKQWESPLALSYKVGIVPFNLLISRTGEIVAIDPVYPEELTSEIEKALTEHKV